jgi:hypothetical protein
MADLTPFTNRIYEGLNNPSCDIFTGMYVGGYFTMKLVFFILISYVLLKALDKLAFEPLLNWIKEKLYKKKKELKK